MAKRTIDVSANGVVAQQEIVHEPAVGADAPAISPARAIQYGGKLLAGDNPLPVASALPTVAISGTKTIATANTFEALVTTATLKSGIWVQAGSVNTGNVIVRYTGTVDGLILEKKDAFFFAIDDPAKLQVSVSVAGERVRWWGS